MRRRRKRIAELKREMELRDAVNRGLDSDTITQLRFSKNFNHALVRHAGEPIWVPYASLEDAIMAILNRDER